MPTVGHLLFAAPAFRAERLKKHEIAIVLAASILPDVDLLAGRLIGNEWAFHRVMTHSLVFVLAFALLHLAVRRRETLLALGGVVSHLALDALDDGGVPLFWPLSPRRVALGFWRGTSIYDMNLAGILRPRNFVADKLCLLVFAVWFAWLSAAALRARLTPRPE